MQSQWEPGKYKEIGKKEVCSELSASLHILNAWMYCKKKKKRVDLFLSCLHILLEEVGVIISASL